MSKTCKTNPQNVIVNKTDKIGGNLMKAQERYDKKNTVQIKMKLNKNTDKDILEKLGSVTNKQGYIKELIRKDLSK